MAIIKVLARILLIIMTLVVMRRSARKSGVEKPLVLEPKSIRDDPAA